MDTKTIKKYDKYSTPKLIEIAQRWCNKYIRLRDEGKGCISCESATFSDAGHFYNTKYSSLRFDEDNIFGQCRHCNSFEHGNLLEYRKGLIRRFDEDFVNRLDAKADYYKRSSFKWDRFSLIETIEKYKKLCKQF